MIRAAAVLSGLLVIAVPWLQEAVPCRVWTTVDAVLAMQCHRFDGRVLLLLGVPMAVCSRCAGIYLGIALGAGVGRPAWSPRTTVWIVIAAGVGMVLEVALEAAGVLGVLHSVRLVTGAALSWPVGGLAVRWLRQRLLGVTFAQVR